MWLHQMPAVYAVRMTHFALIVHGADTQENTLYAFPVQFCESVTVFSIDVTRNSSGDEIANVNFLYDDIVHVLQKTRG